MKKIIMAMLVVATSLTAFSQTKQKCNTKNCKKMTSNLETNKEIALNLSRAIMNGEWDKADALLADDFQYIGDGKPAINKQQYLYFMKEMLCTAMTKMDMKFLRVIAQDNMVAVDYTNEMTNSGAFFGIPATNKRVIGTGQFMRKIENGKVVAEWQTTNNFGLMQQLGVIPTQGK
jgi:predicted ester cyclase